MNGEKSNSEALSELSSFNSELFSERLRLAIGGESINKFASKCGFSESLVRKYLSGSIPGFDKAVVMARAAGVRLEWLAGEGRMHADESGTAIAGPKGMDDYAFVPLYDAQCSAGNGSWNEHSQILTYLSFTRYSLRKQGLTPEQLSAIRIDGDSMEGVLDNGDTVLIDHTRTSIEGEGIYVLRLDGHLYAKRLQRNFDGVRIISENKQYPPIDVPKDRLYELEVIGRAVWAAGWL